MEYYFFRDLDNRANLIESKTYHAAGLVYGIHFDMKTPNFSGKDFAVMYISPFFGMICRDWRSVKDIELFKVSEFEYKDLVEKFTEIENL